MNKKIPKRVFYAFAIVLAWLGFVVEGSHALFIANTTLAGNTITTGTAAIQVSNSQNPSTSTFADTRPGFTVVLNPGDSDEKYFFVKNVSGAEVPLDINVAAQWQSAPPDLIAATTLEFTPVDDTGKAIGPAVTSPLSDLSIAYRGTGVTLSKSAVQRFKVKASLDANYSQQGQSLTYDLRLIGVQHHG